jgi:hypothetical protein
MISLWDGNYYNLSLPMNNIKISLQLNGLEWARMFFGSRLQD